MAETGEHEIRTVGVVANGALFIEPSTTQKVKMLVRYFGDEGPKEGVFTIITDKDLLPEGVASYAFDAFSFWKEIEHNFVST